MTYVTEPTRYQIARDDAATEREHARLAALARARDPQTIGVLERLGVTPGWSCLEVGAGSGTVSRWLAERVQPDGHVLSVDIDLRFHCEPLPGMEVRHLDIVRDPLPDDAFDLVHARAVLEHIVEREQVLDRFVAATRPGGWIVVEDGDWQSFLAQPLPEPLATVSRVMHDGLRMRGWDHLLGSKLLRLFAERGLVELDIVGESRTMRGASESGSWWYTGIEHAADRLVGAGMVTQEQIDGALAIVHDPDFVMMSPLSISVRGRKPA
jgi:SAM-dependent methyltransferase